jgi:transposase
MLRWSAGALERWSAGALERMSIDGPTQWCVVARVIGIGIETADMLVQEVLSRTKRDRRAVPQYQATAAEFINGQMH